MNDFIFLETKAIITNASLEFFSLVLKFKRIHADSYPITRNFFLLSLVKCLRKGTD